MHNDANTTKYTDIDFGNIRDCSDSRHMLRDYMQYGHEWLMHSCAACLLASRVDSTVGQFDTFYILSEISSPCRLYSSLHCILSGHDSIQVGYPFLPFYPRASVQVGYYHTLVESSIVNAIIYTVMEAWPRRLIALNKNDDDDVDECFSA